MIPITGNFDESVDVIGSPQINLNSNYSDNSLSFDGNDYVTIPKNGTLSPELSLAGT